MQTQRVVALVVVGTGVVIGTTALLAIFASRALAAPGAGGFAGPVVPGGRMMSGYGPRPKAGGGTQFHLGVDVRAPEGTPIYAAHAGKVVGVYPDNEVGGYGNTVVIDHETENTAALYAHMQRIDPAMVRGARVEAGQQVGTVGSTDSEGGFSSSSAHLHLEIFLVTGGNRTRSFTHFRGGEGWYPDRESPSTWAAERGIRLF